MDDQAARTLADLRAAELFGRLGEERLRRLAAVARPLRLPARTTVFLQGDPAGSFYLLAEGGVKVYKLLHDGRTATVRHVSPGQTFAEAALFHDTYPSSTETLSDSLLYGFARQDTLELIQAEPEFALDLLAAMGNLLGHLNRRVEDLLLPVPARLARYLLALADEQLDAATATPAGGVPPAGGPSLEAPRVLRLPTIKRELAARLGTVPETLSRTFDRFKRAGVVRMSDDHALIEILDFDALHRLAQD